MQIIEQMWKEYEKNEIPVIASPLDRQQRRKAFLSGILAIYSLMDSMERNKLPKKDVEELVNSVFNESLQALMAMEKLGSKKI